MAAKSPSGAAPAEERNHLYASRPAAVIYATGATEVLNKLPGAAFTQSERGPAGDYEFIRRQKRLHGQKFHRLH